MSNFHASAYLNSESKKSLQVHYGRASFSLLSRLPTFYVLGQAKLDISDCAKKVAGYAAAPLNPEGKNRLLVFLDQPLLWALPALQKAMQLEMDSFQQQVYTSKDLELQSVFLAIKGDFERNCKELILCSLKFLAVR